ncbi:hypothetical protein ZWY2020_024182, partial [Hordeum vulgare]
SHQRNPFNSILIQPPCYYSSHVEAFVTCHCALKDTNVGCAEVTMLNLAINASAYEEGKVVQGRKMNTPHGSLRNVSSFSNCNTRAKISNRRFRRIIEATPRRSCWYTHNTSMYISRAAYSTNFMCRTFCFVVVMLKKNDWCCCGSSTLILDLPFLLPFANLTTSLSLMLFEDVLCVMSTRVFDEKS